MQRIDVWLNDAPVGSYDGGWHVRTIFAPSGTVTFDLSALTPGTYGVVFDIFDGAGNTTHWWEAHAALGQRSFYLRSP